MTSIHMGRLEVYPSVFQEVSYLRAIGKATNLQVKTKEIYHTYGEIFHSFDEAREYADQQHALPTKPHVTSEPYTRPKTLREVRAARKQLLLEWRKLKQHRRKS